MKTIASMLLVAVLALVAIMSSDETRAQVRAKTCKNDLVFANGEGIARGFAELSCRVHWKKAASKKYGGDYGHFPDAIDRSMYCTQKPGDVVKGPEMKGQQITRCQCSGRPCYVR